MITFFEDSARKIIAILSENELSDADVEKLQWLLSSKKLNQFALEGVFVGPRNEMITPWSTNAVEITVNMGIDGIIRMEEYLPYSDESSYDPMLQSKLSGLDQQLFKIEIQPENVIHIDDIATYNKEEGLALNEEEVLYLNTVSKRIGRKLTDSEVFGFSQVNSEHCRHKIFNGQFIIDGEKKENSLFQLIRKTSEKNPNEIVSAYKDNVSFVQGGKAMEFAPKTQNKADFFVTKEIDTVLSLKAETHNFPTTVEPFNGAATGSGGEIRDRMAGGKGSVPMAGTAVYMTSYSRLTEDRNWEKGMQQRKWLYQSPLDILIKASNGASDFGNKFGQPLINGSILTFEHEEAGKKFGFDKVIMLAGGIGYGKLTDAQKEVPKKGDKIVVLGGDNYRIGMGGSAVSSVATGEFKNSIELNAIQRSNPEMQKRVSNAIRALAESSNNPIISIHDHGAGGHLNCLSELVEEVGGTIELRKLPIGDPTLSAKEIVGNESQERMGLVIKSEDIPLLNEICLRERAPIYIVGEITGDHRFKFEDTGSENPIDLAISDMFGKPPKTIIQDQTVSYDFNDLSGYEVDKVEQYLKDVLQLEAVACKDWLTNKVDRSVTGKVAKQQTVGEIQLPLSNLGAVALDFTGKEGIASAIGHAPIAALIDPRIGSELAITEALTNIIWAPLTNGLASVSLSANWMWPCKHKGEDARLYEAVEAVSEFACELGINIPTGKDSLSMVQKYEDEAVYAPGTVIISASGKISDIKKIVEPVIKPIENSKLVYVPFDEGDWALGGSSLAQVLNKLGSNVQGRMNPHYVVKTFNSIQNLIREGKIIAGHDVSSGGLITTLLEMNFPNKSGGVAVDLNVLKEKDLIKVLFSEKPGIVIQIDAETDLLTYFQDRGIKAYTIGNLIKDRSLEIIHVEKTFSIDINAYRDIWYTTSYLLDKNQTEKSLAKARFENYKSDVLQYKFPIDFQGKLTQKGLQFEHERTGIRAAIIREKGVNGDREMAYSMHLAGFDVKDVHMTDLINGHEDLTDVNFIVFVGGFSNSDVLGSAKGWAGAFLYNQKAQNALENFYKREDTLSLGICNGCQLMMELNLIESKGKTVPMLHNDSGKFESAYLNVDVLPSNSVMLNSLSGSRLGIWVAHGEGKFKFEGEESEYNIAVKYSQQNYPGNPNGSDYGAAGIVSDDGRHLAMMPHLERAIFPWQCAHYPMGHKMDDITPWIDAFVNAKNWVASKVKKKEALSS